MEDLLNSNTGNAAIAGMNEDLNLTGNRLNVAVTVFYGENNKPSSPTRLRINLP